MSKGWAVLLTSVVWWGGSALYAYYSVASAANDPLAGSGYEREYWFLLFMFAIFRAPLLLAGYLLLIYGELLLLELYARRH